MKLYIVDNKVSAMVSDEHSGGHLIDAPEGFKMEDADKFIVVDGVLVQSIPQSITKIQAMRAMKQTDVTTTSTMWTSFQALLASNVDANDEWVLALDLQRNHPLVLTLTSALGKTDIQIDDLFILAETL